MHLRFFLPHGYNFVLQYNELTLYSFSKNKFRLFQTENVCRRHFQVQLGRKVSKRAENTVGKGYIDP